MILVLFFFCVFVSSQYYEFVETRVGWVGGTQENNRTSVVAAKGAYHPDNMIGSRYHSAICRMKNSDEIFIFSTWKLDAEIEFNDVWFYSAKLNQFKYARGNYIGLPSIYTNQITTRSYHPQNDIAARGGGSCTAINEDEVVFCCGLGLDTTGTSGIDSNNDFWIFSAHLAQWKYIKGSLTNGNSGDYSTKNFWSTLNEPGSRYGATMHHTAKHEIILMLGYAYSFGPLNDVWLFNFVLLEFYWAKGESTIESFGNYTSNVYEEVNDISARRDAASWKIGNEVFIFGGSGCDSEGLITDLNDLWAFHVILNQWKWITGNKTNPPNDIYFPVGVYSTSFINSRYGASAVFLDEDEVLIFGGRNFNNGFLADVYLYNMKLNLFKFIGGSITNSFNGNYREKGVFAVDVIPSGRLYPFTWVYEDKVFLFGGTQSPSSSSFAYRDVFVFLDLVWWLDWNFLYYAIPSGVLILLLIALVIILILSCLIITFIFSIYCCIKSKNEDSASQSYQRSSNVKSSNVNSSNDIEMKDIRASTTKDRLSVAVVKGWFRNFGGSRSEVDSEPEIFEEDEGKDPLNPSVQINTKLSEINIDEVELLKEIGSGGGDGVVFLVDWNDTKCAFKVFKTKYVFSDQKNFGEFEREAAVISSIHHPNIIQCYGWILKEPRVGILLEFCELGEIGSYIRKQRKKKRPVRMKEKLGMCKGIVDGMSYLHKNKIIHRDLKCNNVLLTRGKVVKIIDFGLAKMMGDATKGKMTTRVGTSWYMAPEVLSGTYDDKCDVFSFGIVLFEVLTEKFIPYEGRDNDGIIELKVANDPNFRPFFPKKHKISSVFVDLIKNCWQHEPDNRPSFEDIKKFFKK